MTFQFQKILFAACRNDRISKLSYRLYCKENGKPKNKLRSFVLTRYFMLVKKSCEGILEKNFPAAAKAYHVFSLGLKQFKDDVLLLFKVYKKINLEGIFSLSRKELEIYHQMPKDMIRVAPVVILGSGLPLGAAFFGLAYMFPKAMLSYHFWTVQQRTDFALIDHKKRLQTYSPVFNIIETQTKNIKSPDLQHSFRTVLGNLSNGINATVEDILKCKPIFEEPLSIRNLGRTHTNSLLKLHSLHRGWRRKIRLEECAALIHAMDLAVLKEGGVETLSQEELERASFFRGLNPVNMKDDDVKIWLTNWLQISKEIDTKCYSLLLHCPVLLAYCQPSNVELLKNKKS